MAEASEFLMSARMSWQGYPPPPPSSNLHVQFASYANARYTSKHFENLKPWLLYNDRIVALKSFNIINYSQLTSLIMSVTLHSIKHASLSEILISLGPQNSLPVVKCD